MFLLCYLVVYQKKRIPVLLFGNKLDVCGKGVGREVGREVESVMIGIEGIMGEGSGLVDGSLENYLKELIKSNTDDMKNIFVRVLYLRERRKLKVVVVDMNLR